MIRLALLLLCLAAPASAGPDRVSVLFGSHHFAAHYPFEEVNPGLFFTWERQRVDWSIGVYRNSFGRLSAAVTVALPLWRTSDFSFDLFAGAALYPGDGRHFAVHAGDLVPIGGAQLRYRNLFAQVMPSDSRATAAIVTFGVTMPLGGRPARGGSKHPSSTPEMRIER